MIAKRAPALIWLLAAWPAHAQQALEISLKNNTEAEAKTKAQLERIVARYPLAKWMFTRKIEIAEREIPHSHPVLTLNTASLDNDEHLLSTFVHEQIHWLEEQRQDATAKALDELRRIYPTAPERPPEGARSSSSTYLHLIVCHLEHMAMRELVGPEKARAVMEHWSRHHYKWIYRTILREPEVLEKVVTKYGLTP